MIKYIVYKTTNLINQKIYVGLHKTETVEFDGYYGSGKMIKWALEKYGVENFVRETLFEFDTLIEARDKERSIVNYEFLQSDLVYNIAVGGMGGNTIAGYSEKEYLDYRERLRIAKAVSAERRKIEGKELHTPEIRAKMSISAKIRVREKPNTLPNNLGRKFRPEAMQRMKDAGLERRGNLIYINDGVVTIPHKSADPIPEGYTVGFGPDRIRLKAHSEETKRRMSEESRVRGTVVYNNGIIARRFHPDDIIPEGWLYGFLPRENAIAKVWINNGLVRRKIAKGADIPEGYVLGKKILIGKENEK